MMTSRMKILLLRGNLFLSDKLNFMKAKKSLFSTNDQNKRKNPGIIILLLDHPVLNCEFPVSHIRKLRIMGNNDIRLIKGIAKPEKQMMKLYRRS